MCHCLCKKYFLGCFFSIATIKSVYKSKMCLWGEVGSNIDAKPNSIQIFIYLFCPFFVWLLKTHIMYPRRELFTYSFIHSFLTIWLRSVVHCHERKPCRGLHRWQYKVHRSALPTSLVYFIIILVCSFANGINHADVSKFDGPVLLHPL